MDYRASQKLVDYSGIWIRRISTIARDFDMFSPLIAAIPWKYRTYFQSNGFSVHYTKHLDNDVSHGNISDERPSVASGCDA